MRSQGMQSKSHALEESVTRRKPKKNHASLTKQQVKFWLEKYDTEEDQYNTGLEQQLGDKLRRTAVLTKDELTRVIEWKFQGRLLGRRKEILNLVSQVPDDFVRKVSNESFSVHDERLRIKKLMGVY